MLDRSLRCTLLFWAFVFLTTSVLLPFEASGQTAIATGTIIPVQLNTSLNSRKAKPGQVIRATVMQDVPLPESKIRAGSKVTGRVLAVTPASRNGSASISFQFDSIALRKQRVPTSTNLRALGSMMTVAEAQLPEMGPDRGTSEYEWTTDQIGGEVAYHGGGPLMRGLQVVGQPTANGVLAHASAVPEAKCRGEIDGNNQLQAFWVCSSNACGTYGFSDLTIAHAGRSNPIGQIVLSTSKCDLNVRSGSGMLLRVNAGQPITGAHEK